MKKNRRHKNAERALSNFWFKLHHGFFTTCNDEKDWKKLGLEQDQKRKHRK